MSIELNNLTDIWFMANGDKTTLFFDMDTDINQIYFEAYENKIWVDVMENLFHSMWVCKLLTEPTTDEVVEQMVRVCKHDPEATPFYTGSLNKTSTRTALYRKSRNLGIKLKTGIHDDTLYCQVNTEEQYDLSKQLSNLYPSDTVELDIPEHMDVETLRSSVFNYGSRHNIRYQTRYINGKLKVKNITIKGVSHSTRSTIIDFVERMPWDIPLPIPDLDMSVNSMTVTCNRRFGGVVTFKNNTVTRNSFRLCKESGELRLRIKGVVVKTFPVSRKTLLSKSDWSAIEEILKQYNVTLERLV